MRWGLVALVVGAGSGDLWALAAEYLAAAVVACADTPEGAAPGRSYIAHAPPAWDCEQITVHAGGPTIANTLPLVPALAPLQRAKTQGMVILAVLTCTVLRCYPVIEDSGDPPTVSELNAASQQTYADLWAITNHVNRAVKAGTLFAGDHREFTLIDPVPVGPEGGIAGWQVPLTVQIPGYKIPSV